MKLNLEKKNEDTLRQKRKLKLERNEKTKIDHLEKIQKLQEKISLQEKDNWEKYCNGIDYWKKPEQLWNERKEIELKR